MMYILVDIIYNNYAILKKKKLLTVLSVTKDGQKRTIVARMIAVVIWKFHAIYLHLSLGIEFKLYSKCNCSVALFQRFYISMLDF